jgi:hypothetical protein
MILIGRPSSIRGNENTVHVKIVQKCLELDNVTQNNAVGSL